LCFTAFVSTSLESYRSNGCQTNSTRLASGERVVGSLSSETAGLRNCVYRSFPRSRGRRYCTVTSLRTILYSTGTGRRGPPISTTRCTATAATTTSAPAID